MTITATATGARTAMSYDAYVALGELPNAEYLGGELVVNASPNWNHQRASKRLTRMLDEVAPAGHEAVQAWSWYLDDRWEPIPDVLLVPSTSDGARYVGTPALVVEILSSSRSADIVIKATRYAQARLPYYWIVDLLEPSVTAYALADGVYDQAGCTVGAQVAALPFAGGELSLAASQLLT